MKRTEKNKDLYKRLVADELMLMKIENSLLNLKCYTDTYCDIYWDRYKGNWTSDEHFYQDFVSACYYLNTNVSASDVLTAMEIVKGD